MLIQIGQLILSHLIAPVIFGVWLLRSGHKSKIDWLITLLIALSYSIHIFLAGRWDWLSYYLRPTIIVLFLAAAFIGYQKARNLPLNSKRTLKQWLSLGCNCFILVIFAALTAQSIQGYFYNEQPISLTFPFQNGTYYVAHGGNSPLINYHNVNPTQRYALDIVKLNSLGTRASGLYPQELTKYAIFGEPISSPCNGEIQAAVDEFPDLTPPETDPEHPTGNYVWITCEEADVFMAHLMSGSIAVDAGEQLETGQAIAKIGNSGNTSEPHLHIHARQAGIGDSIFEGEGIPIRFDGKFLVRNNIFRATDAENAPA